MARSYFVRVGSIPQEVASSPDGWAEAFYSMDFDGTSPSRDLDPTPAGALRTWYETNTGHDPSLDYVTHEGTLTIDTTWLNANNGNGRVSFSNGRWYVERYRVTGVVRFATDNVTARNIHQDSAGSLYALQSRTADGNAHGIIVEHCTLAGNGANDNGAALNFPDARDPDQIIVRYCDISGYRAGIYCFGGITAEYNWVHDLHFSEGSHNTGSSIRAGNVRIRRNLITDGNSSAVSFYPEHGPYTNVLVEENALRLAQADTGPEALLAAGRDFSAVSPGDTRRIINNLFYRGGNGGEGGGIGGYLEGFTEISGNFDRNGAPVSGTDYGVIGARPTIEVRPSSETGPRADTLVSMTGAEAMAAIKSKPAAADGKKYLRRVRITTNLNLATTGSDQLVFEDCVIDVARSSIYAVSAFYTAGATEPAVWPEFRNCEISGGSSASLRGGWVRLLRCDINRGTDLLKPFQAMEVWGSWMHDAYREAGAHCDLIQIVNGCSGFVAHYNNFVGFTAADSPEEPSSWVSGGLQIGSVVGPIGQPVPVSFNHNWVEGGRFGFRGSDGASDNPDNYPVSLVFRDNRFIRDSFQFGPVGNMAAPNDDFDLSNVWDDDNTPIGVQ